MTHFLKKNRLHSRSDGRSENLNINVVNFLIIFWNNFARIALLISVKVLVLKVCIEPLAATIRGCV